MTERIISHVIQDWELGRLCKPEIQRDYVWDRKAVAMLFDSLYNKYPIGAFLFWKPQNVTYFKGLADQKKPKNPDEAILDGQQRITTLYILMTGKVPPYYNDDDIIHDIKPLHVNIETLELEIAEKDSRLVRHYKQSQKPTGLLHRP